jgi:uncharacterized protein YaiL (DUF2058 family)
MKILRFPEPKDGAAGRAGAPSPAADKPSSPGAQGTALPTSKDLAAENAALKAQLLALQSAESQRLQDEDEIAKKTSVGLSRAQAIAVIKRQREFDAARAKEKETLLGKVAVLLKSGLKDQELLIAVRSLAPAASHSVIAALIAEARAISH